MKTARFALAAYLVASICSSLNADHHKSVDLTGVWDAMASTDSDVREIVWTFKKEGGKLTGTSVDQESGDERKLDRITIKEKKVTIEVDIEMDGQEGLIKVVAEEKKPGKLVGKWSIVGGDGTELISGDITAKKQVEVAGDWKTVAILPGGEELESVLKITKKDSKLSGVIDGPNGTVDIDKITKDEDSLKLEFDFDADGNTMEIVIKAKLEGSNKLVGKWSVDGDDGEVSGDWSGTREVKGLAGTWNIVATVPDSDDYTAVMKLTAENGKYAGTSQRTGGEERTMKAVKADEKNIEFTLPYERDGNSGTIKIAAKLQDDGSLKGEWSLVGDDGTEYARDAWTATRK